VSLRVQLAAHAFVLGGCGAGDTAADTEKENDNQEIPQFHSSRIYRKGVAGWLYKE
jgi:hypothetical protein